MASWRLALAELRRGVAERRGGKLLGPDQFLFAFEPLQNKDFDLAGAIGAESNRSGYRGHICRCDGVAKFVAVQGFRARERIGKNLQASVRWPHKRIGRAVKEFLMRFVQLGDFGIFRGEVPAGGEKT